MKGLGSLALAAGLASAVTINPSGLTSVQAVPVVDQAASDGQAESISNIFNGSSVLNGSQISAGDPNFDPASLNLGNVGGVNLGQIDFSSQNSIASGILAMLDVLCAGSLFDINSILSLGVNNDLELFLELLQLMQLEQLGFLNVFDIQSLINSGFNSGFGSVSNLNLFNLGVFKRAVSDRKKTMKRTKLRREPTKTRTKRQCQAAAIDPNAAASVASSVADPNASAAAAAAASAAPAVAAPPPAAAPAAAPPAAAPASAPAAAAPADNGESLSDFTR